jgi:hypothetical protein
MGIRLGKHRMPCELTGSRDTFLEDVMFGKRQEEE